MLEINLLSHRKTHARTLVNDQLTAQVGLLFVAFNEKFFGTAIEFPVDMTDRFARIVKPVLGKFHRKTMERTFVQPRNETFDNLPRQKLQTAELRQMVPINGKIRHRMYTYLKPSTPREAVIPAFAGIPFASRLTQTGSPFWQSL